MRAYGTRGGGIGNEWRYVFEFSPFSPKDVPGWGEKARKAANRVELAINAAKPGAVGPRRPIRDWLQCGALDSKLKDMYEREGYKDGQPLTRQQADDFLKKAYEGHRNMRDLYDSSATMLDAAREKGGSNWYSSWLEQAHPGEF